MPEYSINFTADISDKLTTVSNALGVTVEELIRLKMGELVVSKSREAPTDYIGLLEKMGISVGDLATPFLRMLESIGNQSRAPEMAEEDRIRMNLAMQGALSCWRCLEKLTELDVNRGFCRNCEAPTREQAPLNDM